MLMLVPVMIVTIVMVAMSSSAAADTEEAEDDGVDAEQHYRESLRIEEWLRMQNSTVVLAKSL